MPRRQVNELDDEPRQPVHVDHEPGVECPTQSKKRQQLRVGRRATPAARLSVLDEIDLLTADRRLGPLSDLVLGQSQLLPASSKRLSERDRRVLMGTGRCAHASNVLDTIFAVSHACIAKERG